MAKAPADRYGSDLIVDMIKRFEIPWIALNPGASYRGLHDSLVNYGGNQPPIILCTHEEIAVFMALGYAQVTGRPMAAAVHDTVGLLNASLAVYHAYLERVPLILIGSNGPMDPVDRRPGADWVHSAVPQDRPIHDYVKWSHQPVGAHDVAESFARAYRVAMQEPQGPVYLCYDSGFQEASLEEEILLPELAKSQPGTPTHPDPAALDLLAERLVTARQPVILTGSTGRHHESFYNLIELAEALGAGVAEQRDRLSFPSHHPLNISLAPARTLADADVILALDVKNLFGALSRPDPETERSEYAIRKDAFIAEIGYRDLDISKWSEEFGRFVPVDLQITGSTLVAIPELTARVKKLLDARPEAKERARARAEAIAQVQKAVRERIPGQVKQEWDSRPVAPSRLASEVWQQIKDEDWVLTVNPLWGQATRLWNFDKPERWPGVIGGMQTGRTISSSLGIALAHKGSGKLVVDLQNDGDLLYAPGALWTAANQELPLLMVMNNNRAYGNDWSHQVHVARHRGRPVENARIGQEINDPAPDFATIARGFGIYAEGPIEDPAQLAGALERAIAVVKEGKPALVDVVTAGRYE